MTGEINGVKVVCFPAKPSERGPAWRVLKSKPKDGGPAVPPVSSVSSDDVPW
jgi:hypothetical protein